MLLRILHYVYTPVYNYYFVVWFWSWVAKENDDTCILNNVPVVGGVLGSREDEDFTFLQVVLVVIDT
jgi:hypothetical protein